MEVFAKVVYEKRAAIFALFTFLLVYVVYAAWSMRNFYPDGTIFFTHILQVVKPVHWHWDRQFAYYVQHFPLIAAIKSGIADIPTLARIHTGWYFSFGLISLVANWFMIPKKKKIFFLFPLCWMFAFYMNTEFFPITPGRLLTCIFWMIFNLALFRNSWWSIVLVAFIGWPLLRIYQGMLILGPVLTAVAFWKATQLSDKKLKAICWGLFGIYFIGGTVLSFLSVLNPQDPTSFVTFLIGILLVFDEEFYPHWPQFLSLFVFIFFGWSLVKRKFFFKWQEKFTLLFYSFALIVFLMPLIWPQSLAPETHQQVRSLNIYFTALLSFGAFLMAIGRLKPPEAWVSLATKTLIILGFVQVGWAIQATYQWNSYIDIFQEELASLPPGLQRAQDTSLLDLNNNYRLSNGLHNDWDTALMSVLFSPTDSVKTVIAHSFDNVYYPVDPKSRESMPDLEKYGVTLNPYFEAFSKQDSVVIPDRPLPKIFQWFETETVGENDYFED